MKADRHDAPEWIRSSSRKRGNLGVVIPGLIGTVVTIGALYVASQAFLQGTVKNLAESKQQPTALPVAEIRRAEPETDWSKVVEEQARRDAMSQPQAELPTKTATKQTVFNDLNYKPRGADNVLAFEDTYQPIEPEKPAAKMRVTVIKEEQKLKDWVCGSPNGSVEQRNCKSRVGLQYRN
ncbi:hypothetical protein DBR00_15930 [Pseudomonas sp. HMWF032]|uniref:hypothetical protein n=1 Tax=Pseudomonas sp. HMWF032 TaxID=2056866 RepID=UPI000D3714DF|nr:hypothetical protein [Pseudomonas sp. HMWF032]PTS83142.1 hypothetical protein DBR00_15930 [Pseudomonas sp. HMWF032]PTT79940.1 hypothetical protein DBR41_20770 [Pseudomonas sp. HMWF010]